MHRKAANNVRLLASILLGLLLSGCFSAGKRGSDAAMTVYDLGPAASGEMSAPRKQPMAVEVRAPLWFDALAINYRLNYAEPTRLREYARARWVGPPAQLIQLHLGRGLGLIPAGQGRAACVLRLDIEEFSQIFDSPVISRGVLQGRLQWLDRGRGQLAEQRVDIRIPAGSADSRGGVAALTAAVETLTANISGWEQGLLASGRLRSCQP